MKKLLFFISLVKEMAPLTLKAYISKTCFQIWGWFLPGRSHMSKISISQVVAIRVTSGHLLVVKFISSLQCHKRNNIWHLCHVTPSHPQMLLSWHNSLSLRIALLSPGYSWKMLYGLRVARLWWLWIIIWY